MQIKMFCDLDKKTLEKISVLHYEKWRQHNPRLIFEDVIKEYLIEYSQQKDKIPCGFAFFEEKELIGFCRLCIKNLAKYPHIYPWISSALVLEKYRGHGYGTKLIRTAEALLRDFGYKTAYLWTDQAPDFYPKIGYEFLQEVERDDGGLAKLFKKDL